jgi:Mrp family chromosome partitioning ATPase
MDEMRNILEELRGQYDLVLVDCCPVLPVADALLIGKRVDGVLLSVRPRLSTLPQVHAACERLSTLRIPVLGAVVNGVRARMSSYEYKYLLESNA